MARTATTKAATKPKGTATLLPPPPPLRPRLPWTAEYPHRNVAVVTFHAAREKGFSGWVLLSSDRHHDNPHCNQKLELKHLRQAKERGAAIIDAGDLHCAMQGKYDKRSNKDSIRPENQSGDYLDSLVRTAADFYQPFAHNFVVIGDGNHETSIRNRHETDLNERLCQLLRDRTGCNVQHGGYYGWVRFVFKIGGVRKFTKTLNYIHGYGGGGPVTLDMIQAQRRRAYVEGADLMFSGHTHDEWITPTMKVGLSERYEQWSRRCYSIKTPTYKDEFDDGHGGFHVETGKPPKPIGAVWVNFHIEDGDMKMNVFSAQ
jgi:hypothetical protein